MNPFKKAAREGSRIRVLLPGVSGSGKTYTALALARHMAGPDGRVAVIDTEKDSARKYAGTKDKPSMCLCSGCRGHGVELEFDATSLERHGPNDYMSLMKAAANEHYDVLVIDSLSHEWEGNGGVLQQVDAAKAHSKNQISPWAKPSLAHDQFIQAIVAWPGHVVATVRAKERIDVKTGNSKGITPIQRDGLEYEFDFVCFMSDARGQLVKSRAPHLQGQIYQLPGKDMASALTEWAGEAPRTAEPSAVNWGMTPEGKRINALLVGYDEGKAANIRADLGSGTDIHAVLEFLESRSKDQQAEPSDIHCDVCSTMRHREFRHKPPACVEV